jgi:hypothetical protein
MTTLDFSLCLVLHTPIGILRAGSSKDNTRIELVEVEMDSYGLWACSPPDWALICLVSGPSPFGVTSDVCIAVLLVYI